MAKLDFNVRMFDVMGNQRDEKYPAANARQALMVAMSAPGNERYVDFGIIGRDGNCHQFDHRPGTRRSPRGRMGTLAEVSKARRDAAAEAAKAAKTVVKVSPAPLPIDAEQLTQMTISRALPQVSKLDTFTVRLLKEKLPVSVQPAWTPTMWAKVMPRLLRAGAIVKVDHRNYRLAPGFTPPPSAEGTRAPSGNGKDAHAAPPQEAPLPPSVEPAQPAVALTAADKSEVILVMAQHLLRDNRDRDAKFKALADRMVDVLSEIDRIRSDLDALRKMEDAVPAGIMELVKMLRGNTAATPAAH